MVEFREYIATAKTRPCWGCGGATVGSMPPHRPDYW